MSLKGKVCQGARFNLRHIRYVSSGNNNLSQSLLKNLKSVNVTTRNDTQYLATASLKNLNATLSESVPRSKYQNSLVVTFLGIGWSSLADRCDGEQRIVGNLPIDACLGLIPRGPK